MKSVALFAVLISIRLVFVTAQAPHKEMSMQYTTAALSTLRCMRDAVNDVQALTGCHASMNAAEDLMRSPMEQESFRLIAKIGVAASLRDSEMQKAIADFAADWGAHHLVGADTDEDAEYMAAGKRVTSKMDLPVRTSRQLDCMDDVTKMLRAGVMRSPSRCNTFFSEEQKYSSHR